MLISRHTLQTYWPTIISVAVVACLILSLFSLAFGAVPISFKQLLSLPFDNADSQTQLIIQELRLPRALLALCVGCLLASCGAITQGLFRNPLADPSLIGVSAGASAGASLVIVFLGSAQLTLTGLSYVSLGAFAGSILTVVVVYRIATGNNGTSVATMLLAGIAITFLAGSVTNLLEFVSDDEMLRRISLWRMGGLDAANYPRVLIAAGTTLAMLLSLPFLYPALNALLLGESEARHLGVDVDKIKRTLIILCAAGVGVSVALAGTISFVGLIVPHMVRMLIGPNHRYLIPVSAIVGALLLVFADAFARTIIAPTELPVGLVTSIIGVPIFISLLRKRHHYGMQ